MKDWREEEPTKRQIDYAQDLGIVIPEGITRGELSSLISISTGEDKAVRPGLISAVESLGIPVHPHMGKKGLFDYVFTTLNVPGKEKELAAWFAFRVYRNLSHGSDDAGIGSPDSPVIMSVATELAASESVMKSIRRYKDGRAWIFFGKWTPPNGPEIEGGSAYTIAYKAAKKLLDPIVAEENLLKQPGCAKITCPYCGGKIAQKLSMHIESNQYSDAYKECARPKRSSIGCFVVSGLIISFVSFKLIGYWALISLMFFIIITITNYQSNKEFPKKLEEWETTFVCLTCKHFFFPSKSELPYAIRNSLENTLKSQGGGSFFEGIGSAIDYTISTMEFIISLIEGIVNVGTALIYAVASIAIGGVILYIILMTMKQMIFG